MSPDFFDLDDFLDELFLSLSRGSGETDTEDFFFALWWWCLAFVECLTIWDATTAGLISTTRESVEVVGV